MANNGNVIHLPYRHREMRLHITIVFCRDRSWNLADSVQGFDTLESVYRYLDEYYPDWMSFCLTVLP